MDVIYILQLIKFFCNILTYFASGVIVNAVQCVLYLTLKPRNKVLYRKINYYLSYTLNSQLIAISEWYTPSEIYVYVDENEYKYFGKEHACVVMNHKYEIDWLSLGVFAEKSHTGGSFKSYMKKIIQYIPSMGWCLFFSENIFLSRSFDKDKEIIQKQLREIVDFPYPFWLVLYPEGTRFSSNKHTESLRIAKAKGLPELKHHLLPKPKGFLTSLPPMRGKVGAIYDATMSIHPEDEVEPTMFNVLMGKKVVTHIYVRRIPLEDVPEDENEATKFLNDMFVFKDKLHESFFKTRDYFAESGVKRIEPIKLSRSYFTLLHSIFWHVVIILPLVCNLIKIFLTADIFTISMTIFGISLFISFIYLALAVNKVKPGPVQKNSNNYKKTE